MISAAFRTRVLGVGQLLRGEIRARSPRASLAAEAMAAGALLPDWLVIELLEGRIACSDDGLALGWLLDGFPRTLSQARATLSAEHASLRPDCVLVVDRPDELVKEFALGRMADAATGATYHPTYAPAPRDIEQRLVWRVDDTPAVVEARLRDHRESIEPIVGAYECAGIPVLRLDNARSELRTFAEAAAFVERVGDAKLAQMGGREAFRARVFGGGGGGGGGASSGASIADADVEPICLLDEGEDECMRRYASMRASSAASAAVRARSGGAPTAGPMGASRGLEPLLEAVRRCNLADRSQYMPVLVDDITVGYASVAFVEQICAHFASGGRGFELVPRSAADAAGRGSSPGGAGGAPLGGVALRLAPGVVGLDERTAAVGALVAELVADGAIAPSSVRAELQDVWPVGGRQTAPAGQPVLRIERGAMVHFGVPSYGVHVNGYVLDAHSGRPAAVWLARRSMSKATYPGLLDQMVAGGQPAELSFDENMRKECAEEASLPPDAVGAARGAGVVSYCYSTRKGLSTKALAVYDLCMPADLEPVNADGEVDEFVLLSVDDALQSVRERLPLWKPNAALVMVDFAVRHGFVTPDEAGYEQLVRGLRAGMEPV